MENAISMHVVMTQQRAEKRRHGGSEESSDSEDSDSVADDSDGATHGSRLEEMQERLKILGSKRSKPEIPIKDLEVVPKLEEEAEEEDMDIQILPSPPKMYACSCGKRLKTHSDCHKHIFDEHGDHDIKADCLECGNRLNDIRTNNQCSVCKSYAENVEEHEKSHYRTSTSKHAVMECRYCVRQFRTVKEVIEHEKEKHLAKPLRKTQFFKCNECSVVFTSQEVLTGHYGDHVDLNLLNDKIEELQYQIEALKEECPFCRIFMASRKSFRAHLLKHHWLACKSLASVVPTDEEIKKEIDELTASMVDDEDDEDVDIEIIEVKKEVKDEIQDYGYPAS